MGGLGMMLVAEILSEVKGCLRKTPSQKSLTAGKYPFSIISSLVRWAFLVFDREKMMLGAGTSGKAAWIVST